MSVPTPPAGQAPAPAPSPDTITEATYQRIILIFACTISVILVMITGVLCFRVALDGDSAITQQITNQLVGIVPWLAGSLVAAVVGSKGIASLIGARLGG